MGFISNAASPTRFTACMSSAIPSGRRYARIAMPALLRCFKKEKCFESPRLACLPVPFC
jgi:hypothetical protein